MAPIHPPNFIHRDSMLGPDRRSDQPVIKERIIRHGGHAPWERHHGTESVGLFVVAMAT